MLRMFVSWVEKEIVRRDSFATLKIIEGEKIF